MEQRSEKEANMSNARHMVGGNIGLAAIFYAGNGDPAKTAQDMQTYRDESVRNLEVYANGEGNRNEDILKFIEELRKSDWSTKESFAEYRKIYSEYVAPAENEAREELKKLFGGNNKMK